MSIVTRLRIKSSNELELRRMCVIGDRCVFWVTEAYLSAFPWHIPWLCKIDKNVPSVRADGRDPGRQASLKYEVVSIIEHDHIAQGAELTAAPPRMILTCKLPNYFMRRTIRLKISSIACFFIVVDDLCSERNDNPLVLSVFYKLSDHSLWKFGIRLRLEIKLEAECFFPGKSNNSGGHPIQVANDEHPAPRLDVDHCTHRPDKYTVPPRRPPFIVQGIAPWIRSWDSTVDSDAWVFWAVEPLHRVYVPLS